MQKPKLEDVLTIPDIKINVRTFNKEAKDNLDIIKGDYFTGLKPVRRYWVYDSDTSQFGPSKFVAYKNMNFELREKIHLYQNLSEKEQFSCNGVYYTGIYAHKKNAEVARKEFQEPNQVLIEEFENWAEKLSRDLSKVNTDKYKFLEL